MSSLLEGSLAWRTTARKVELLLRQLRIRGKSILMEYDQAQEVNRKMLRLCDANIMDPNYSALLQADFLELMINRKRKQCAYEGTSLCPIRLRQFMALVVQICEHLRKELKDILQQVCEKVSSTTYYLDSTHNLTHRIPQHLAKIDDLISVRAEVIDSKIEEYIDEAFRIIRNASNECQDITHDGQPVAKDTFKIRDDDQSELSEVARLRNQMYADFVKEFNWGDLPFPPLLKKRKIKSEQKVKFSPRRPSAEEEAYRALTTPVTTLSKSYRSSIEERHGLSRNADEGFAAIPEATLPRNRHTFHTTTTMTTSLNLCKLSKVPGYNVKKGELGRRKSCETLGRYDSLLPISTNCTSPSSIGPPSASSFSLANIQALFGFVTTPDPVKTLTPLSPLTQAVMKVRSLEEGTSQTPELPAVSEQTEEDRQEGIHTMSPTHTTGSKDGRRKDANGSESKFAPPDRGNGTSHIAVLPDSSTQDSTQEPALSETHNTSVSSGAIGEGASSSNRESSMSTIPQEAPLPRLASSTINGVQSTLHQGPDGTLSGKSLPHGADVPDPSSILPDTETKTNVINGEEKIPDSSHQKGEGIELSSTLSQKSETDDTSVIDKSSRRGSKPIFESIDETMITSGIETCNRTVKAYMTEKLHDPPLESPSIITHANSTGEGTASTTSYDPLHDPSMESPSITINTTNTKEGITSSSYDPSLHEGSVYGSVYPSRSSSHVPKTITSTHSLPEPDGGELQNTKNIPNGVMVSKT